jgi:hypothetical protein
MPNLFHVEQDNSSYTDWWARLNYQSDDSNAVRFILSHDKGTDTWTMRVQIEDNDGDGGDSYGNWIDVLAEDGEPLTPAQAAMFLALTHNHAMTAKTENE